MARNLSSTIARLASDTITVHRKAASTLVNGIATEGGDASTFTALASVQPAAGRDLLRLDEGERTREVLAIWTAAALQTASQSGHTAADVIDIPGRGSFEVQHVDNWSASGAFSRYVIVSVAT